MALEEGPDGPAVEFLRLPTERPVLRQEDDVLIGLDPDFNQKVDSVASLIVSDSIHDSNRSRTIAIVGEWGSGKTSVANILIQRAVEQRNTLDLGVGRFNVHSHEVAAHSELRLRLISTVLATLQPALRSLVLERLGFDESVPDSSVLSELREREESGFVDLETDLASAVGRALAKLRADGGELALLMLVDDLDRSSVAAASATLRAIARWSELGGLTFLIATTETRLHEAAAASDHNVLGNGQHEVPDRETIDKFVHLMLRVPRLIDGPDRAASYCLQTFSLPTGREAPLTWASRLGGMFAVKAPGLSPLLAESNPRRMKKVLSQLVLEVAKPDTPDAIGIKEAVCRTYWPVAYRTLCEPVLSSEVRLLLDQIADLPSKMQTEVSVSELVRDLAPQLLGMDTSLLLFAAQEPRLFRPDDESGVDSGSSEPNAGPGPQLRVLNDPSTQLSDTRIEQAISTPSASEAAEVSELANRQVAQVEAQVGIDTDVIEMQRMWVDLKDRLQVALDSEHLELMERLCEAVVVLWARDKRSMPRRYGRRGAAVIGNAALRLERSAPSIAYQAHEVALNASSFNSDADTWANVRCNFADFVADLIELEAAASPEDMSAAGFLVLEEVARQFPGYRPTRQLRQRLRIEDALGRITEPERWAADFRELLRTASGRTEMRDYVLSMHQLQRPYSELEAGLRELVEAEPPWLSPVVFAELIRFLADYETSVADDHGQRRIGLYSFLIGSTLADESEKETADAAHNLGVSLRSLGLARESLLMALLAYSLNPNDISIRSVTSDRLAVEGMTEAAVAAAKGEPLPLGEAYPYGQSMDDSYETLRFNLPEDRWWIEFEPDGDRPHAPFPF